MSKKKQRRIPNLTSNKKRLKTEKNAVKFGVFPIIMGQVLKQSLFFGSGTVNNHVAYLHISPRNMEKKLT